MSDDSITSMLPAAAKDFEENKIKFNHDLWLSMFIMIPLTFCQVFSNNVFFKEAFRFKSIWNISKWSLVMFYCTIWFIGGAFMLKEFNQIFSRDVVTVGSLLRKHER